MSIQIRFLRGTTAQNTAYTGAAGTFSIDTQLNQVRVHDGVTAGGYVVGDASADLATVNQRIDDLVVADIGGLVAALTAKADTSALTAGLALKIDASLIGANNGIAPLDAGGRVAAIHLPSYVDDVIEAADFASLPGTGEVGKIYVTLDDSKVWRWSGSAYVEIVASPGSTDSVAEGSTNLYFTNARARAAVSATGSLSYNSSTGEFSYTTPDSDGITEGATNLYFTQARARSAISVTGDAGLSYNSGTGVITYTAPTVTKAAVGLGDVENYGVATQAEAEAASVNNKYVTPLRVRNFVEGMGFTEVAAGEWVIDMGVLA